MKNLGHCRNFFDSDFIMKCGAFLSVMVTVFNNTYVIDCVFKSKSCPCSASICFKIYSIEKFSVFDISLSSNFVFGGHSKHILFSSMKRALPFFTRPFALLG